ncbi:MAG: UDP-N-acetylmuramoyl-L-alanine--D-glutamate ligase [Synergistaceae bacterium]|nr:UDP-N-acetylmuramoyl-L-alanine--D-glutamate ligase [Synergistaceae bacterium]
MERITIIGSGVSGSALAFLAKKLGHEVFISDAKDIKAELKQKFIEQGIQFEDGGHTQKVLECDKIIPSPAIPHSLPILQMAQNNNIPIVGELDFVYPYLNGKIISVTGSNGKTTTTSLIGHLLKEQGCKTAVGGNIGLGVAELALESFDYIVLELSSFQLSRAKTFRTNVGIVTNLAPDHINWHGSLEAYVEAKAVLLKSVVYGGLAICQLSDKKYLETKSYVNRKFISWYDTSENSIYCSEKDSCAFIGANKLFDFANTTLLGKHNMENIAMALTALAFFNVSSSKDALYSFKAPDHRCNFVAQRDGVIFVNDSKGTNVAATVTALTSLPNKKIIILGGQGKGESYEPLASVVAENASYAILLGEEKEKIAAALKGIKFNEFEFANDMKGAVAAAYSHAKSGETVLLSPACTSWDMYPSYEARGEDFVHCVRDLIGG